MKTRKRSPRWIIPAHQFAPDLETGLCSCGMDEVNRHHDPLGPLSPDRELAHAEALRRVTKSGDVVEETRAIDALITATAARLPLFSSIDMSDVLDVVSNKQLIGERFALFLSARLIEHTGTDLRSPQGWQVREYRATQRLRIFDPTTRGA